MLRVIIKDTALREAQKAPSVETLITNLKGVKNLRLNNPVFHPSDDYRIPNDAAAIVLRRQIEGNRSKGDKDNLTAA